MSDYLQPDFYRFNQDSLILVEWIIKQNVAVKSILDLGAGCGVIGLELAKKLQAERVVLVELQNDFEEFLKKNTSDVRGSEIVMSSFSEWQSEEKFDLIVSNPPYYLPHAGRPSQDLRRGIARSFIKDDWNVLLAVIKRNLLGKCFIVLKNDKEILRFVKTDLKRIDHVLGDLVIIELSNT